MAFNVLPLIFCYGACIEGSSLFARMFAGLFNFRYFLAKHGSHGGSINYCILFFFNSTGEDPLPLNRLISFNF